MTSKEIYGRLIEAPRLPRDFDGDYKDRAAAKFRLAAGGGMGLKMNPESLRDSGETCLKCPTGIAAHGRMMTGTL